MEEMEKTEKIVGEAKETVEGVYMVQLKKKAAAVEEEGPRQ